VTGGADFEAFCAVEWPRLVGALSLYTGDVSLAEELAQEALERACLRWGSVQQMDRPGAWVHRVATNLAASRFRRTAAGRRADARLAADARDVAGPDADQFAMRAAVAALPARTRTAIVLRYHLGYTPEEAGLHMGCSAQAVRNLTHRGLQLLRKELLDREDIAGPTTGATDAC